MSLLVSYNGLLISVLLLLPNLLFLSLFPPKDVPTESNKSHFFFYAIERLGQVSCLFFVITTPIEFISLNIWWMLLVFCLCAYYFLWVRYLLNGRKYSFLFCSFLLIPIPMAVLPCCIFFLAAIIGESFWLGLAALIFSIGHLKVSGAK